MATIIYQKNKCIGCHACVEWAPDRWRISRKDGKSILMGSQLKKKVYVAAINDREVLQNLRAAEKCPLKAIKVCA
ncbi:MAG TPA: ferredoxin [Cyclobacteriaceae bacterium]|jgi:ferredoxin|nr:ferredoxin [Cyclobacteriaceae bacterium]HMV10538.1 ferredoxin [Cyclobacteriaceae bacterium]HMV89608.1 ferredoxin [Cyclobacteriaceae bacterium]HMW99450.1 ferredoxin [Cyclobacteriaceae bacterium]HMX48761.1 ferredoxin [Cyclobacteriaceae bacterium]